MGLYYYVLYMTPRDHVYACVLKGDRIRWTTERVLQEVGEDVSEYTVRDTLNAMSKTGILTHESNSRYWFVHPDYA